MKMRRGFVSTLAFVLSFALVEVSFVQNASAAGMISTSQVVADSSRAGNLEKINTFLSRQEVRSELVKQGVDPKEAANRIAALSDFEIQKVAGNIDNAPAGAEVVVIGLGTILLIVIIILLVRR